MRFGKKKRKECHKKPVKKGWIEDLVVSETMKMIMDDDAIEAIVSMLMELQEQDNTNIPLYERQLQETNTKIRNLINAIQQGVLTKSTKESLEELEAAKEELETRLANEQLSKPPKISAEFMTFWLHRFRKLDVTKQSHRKMLIDTFINAIYLAKEFFTLLLPIKEKSSNVVSNVCNADSLYSDALEEYWFSNNKIDNIGKKISADFRAARIRDSINLIDDFDINVMYQILGNLYLSNITESNFYSKNMIAGIELVKFIVRFPVGNRTGKKQHDNPSRVALIRQY